MFKEEVPYKTISLLKTSVCLVALIEIFLRLPYWEFFYKSSSLVGELGDNGGITFIFKLFEYIPQEETFLLIIFIYIGSLFFSIIGYYPLLFSILSWYLNGVLNYHNPAIADGGSAVILILLFFNIFFNIKLKSSETTSILHHLILKLIQLQVCFIYLSAGLTKIGGELWTKGVAVYYALQVDQFSLPFIQETIANNSIFVTLATYGTLLFQLSFPYLIWNKKLRPVIIMFGSLIHLQISFLMGLVTFGLIMTVSYFSFYSNEKSERILSLFCFNPLSVYFDSNCEICMRISKFVQLFKIPGLLNVKTTSDLDLKEFPNANITIHSISHKKAFQGFETFYQVSKRTFLMPMLFPFFLILNVSGIGSMLYNKVIQSNWRKNCINGHCSLP